MAKTIEEKRKALKAGLTELAEIQEKMKGGNPLSQAEGEKADSLAEEMESIQKEIDQHDAREKRFGRIQTDGSKLADPTLPPEDGGSPEEKALDQIRRPEEKVIGYARLGDFVTSSKGLKRFLSDGRPRAPYEIVRIKGQPMEAFVPITRKMVEEKAVPTLGSGVIEPTRVPEIVRVTEHDELTLRDVLNVSQTESDAVKFTRIVSYTRAAATVEHSGQKPEASIELDSVTEPVKTVAVHIPVEEQQLADFPALRGLIDGELLYDLDKHLEELVIWGDGTGEDFTGIMRDSDVGSAREEQDDTLIDIARRGITDVRRAGYQPNAILVDPLDWESIVLSKGTDNRYVWVVVTEGSTQRLWGVPAIETVAMEDFQGNSTEERGMLVGDFMRGATLWDRQDSSISVGWIDKQFITNQRTILAELRAAFGVRRPGAFRKHQTQAPAS